MALGGQKVLFPQNQQISFENTEFTFERYLHEVTEAPLAEDIFEENQVLFVVGIRVELRGEQGQSLMQPCIS